MRKADTERRGIGRQFWPLAALLCVVLLTGGSSFPNATGLVLLRPFSILLAAYGLLTLRREHWRQYRLVAVIAALMLLLPVLHLLPLPFGIWSHLPGRELIRDIDAFALGRTHWRPLTMVPEATWNALYSLGVPIGVLALAAQQERQDQLRVLGLLILLMAMSAVVGVLQASAFGVRAEDGSSDFGGMFTNRNHQGAALALLVPMLGVGAVARIRTARKAETWPLVTAAAVASVAVVLVIISGSRTALGLILLSSLLTPLILYGTLPEADVRRARRRDWRRLGVSVGIVAILIGALILVTMVTARDHALGRIAQAANDPRYAVWGTVAEAIPSFLPLGSGIGTYADVYQTFEPAESLRPTYSNHAHNEFLEIALTAGLPGVAIALAAAVALVLGARRSIRAKGQQALFNRLGVAIITLLALASITDYPVRTPIFSAVVALAAIWASLPERLGSDPSQRKV